MRSCMRPGNPRGSAAASGHGPPSRVVHLASLAPTLAQALGADLNLGPMRPRALRIVSCPWRAVRQRCPAMRRHSPGQVEICMSEGQLGILARRGHRHEGHRYCRALTARPTPHSVCRHWVCRLLTLCRASSILARHGDDEAVSASACFVGVRSLLRSCLGEDVENVWS